jgi:lipopolysaccharide biosynthesis regulator YciM
VNLKNFVIYTLVVVFILLILLIAYNNVAPTTVNLKFVGIREFTVPAWAVMVASFMIGLIVAFVWSLIVSTLQGIESLSTKRREKNRTRLDTLYQEGLRQMLECNNEKAESIFKKILKTDRKNLKALTAIGNSLREQGKHYEAEEYHLKALLIDEQNLPALEGLYADYIAKSKGVLAKNTVRKILDHRDADTLRYKKELAAIYMDDKNWDDVIRLQQEIIKASAKDDKKLEKRKLLYFEYQRASDMLGGEDSKEAERILRKTKEKNKTFAPAYVRLGLHYIDTEDYANAFKILSEGYNATREPVFLTMIEDLYISTNQPDDAIEFFKSMSKQYPKEVLPVFTLGKLYYRFEIIDEAKDIFNTIMAEVDYSPTLEYYVAKTESRREKKKEAVERLKNLIRKSHLLDMNYACSKCGYSSEQWLDRCPECGCWDCIGIAAKSELNVLEVKKIVPPRYY